MIIIYRWWCSQATRLVSASTQGSHSYAHRDSTQAKCDLGMYTYLLWALGSICFSLLGLLMGISSLYREECEGKSDKYEPVVLQMYVGLSILYSRLVITNAWNHVHRWALSTIMWGGKWWVYEPLKLVLQKICCIAYVPSTVSVYALLSRLVANLTPCNMATSYSSLLTAIYIVLQDLYACVHLGGEGRKVAYIIKLSC